MNLVSCVNIEETNEKTFCFDYNQHRHRTADVSDVPLGDLASSDQEVRCYIGGTL